MAQELFIIVSLMLASAWVGVCLCGGQVMRGATGKGADCPAAITPSEQPTVAPELEPSVPAPGANRLPLWVLVRRRREALKARRHSASIACQTRLTPGDLNKFRPLPHGGDWRTATQDN